MKIISWDCAYHSLAYIILEIDLAEARRVRGLSAAEIALARENVCERRRLHTWLRFIAADVVDLREQCDRGTDEIVDNRGNDRGNGGGIVANSAVDGNSSEIQLAIALGRFLRREFPNPRIFARTIIEHQPRMHNSSSYGVSVALASYFADASPEFISPKLKNKIVLAPGLEYERYCARFESTKRARKQHAADSFTYFCIIWARPDILGRIAACSREHVGDALLQALCIIRAGI